MGGGIMAPPQSLNLLRGYLDAQRYQGPGGDDRSRQPFVTLSRESGAGGLTIATRLAERLAVEDRAATTPWTVFDRELLQLVAEQHNLPRELADVMDPTRYNRLLRWVDELLGGNHPSWSSIVQKANEAILHLAGIGNVILVGHGANVLTFDVPGGIHVRVVGSLPLRISHIADHLKLTREEAEAYIDREDRNRATYVKDYFGVEIGDVHCYDLTINTDHVSYDDAAGLILNQVRQVRTRLRDPAAAGGQAKTV